MNLYKFHYKPASLDYYGAMGETNPMLFWKKYKNDPEELEKREKYTARDAEYAYSYAKTVLKSEPFPRGEEAIARDAEYSYLYAKNILKSSFSLSL